MLEEWKRRFEETGEVEVRASRRAAVLRVAAALVMFGLAMVLLLLPGSRYPLLLVRSIGWVGALFFGGALVVMVRHLLVPPVLLRLDQRSLMVRFLPPATWDEVLGASTTQYGGWTLTSIQLVPRFWLRAEPSGPPQRLERRFATSGVRQGSAKVGPMIPGGADDLTRLVLWARQQAAVGER